MTKWLVLLLSDRLFLFCVVLFLVILILKKAPLLMARCYLWLKGSRMRYWIDNNGDLHRSNQLVYFSGPSLEIKRSPFYNRSIIHIPVHIGLRYWKISKIWTNRDGDCVTLNDTGGVSVETALKILSKYQSLQSMLEQIDRLEEQVGKLKDKLAWAESHGRTWLASLEALRQEIDSDRQRYRSQAAQNIRERLEKTLQHARSLAQIPDEKAVDSVKSLWANTAFIRWAQDNRMLKS